ncbi:hypothetical protein A2290_01925 [candidate division WOR-1 bacterium RIFOXYB2_FULL_36_35]|uniref:Uncharacterized protein n=1 Tax=candidate division WOR-1 bacterium RIFOXYB2_FULL_36_35 TaxID=1802578 RepID=A0A1F4RZ72_UNCSA|nr:MAG: hypothetical protein A2290_01925 [candidate division WOR-1 bacterium RIFOXYB2_FULL_36_35]
MGTKVTASDTPKIYPRNVQTEPTYLKMLRQHKFHYAITGTARKGFTIEGLDTGKTARILLGANLERIIGALDENRQPQAIQNLLVFADKHCNFTFCRNTIIEALDTWLKSYQTATIGLEFLKNHLKQDTLKMDMEFKIPGAIGLIPKDGHRVAFLPYGSSFLVSSEELLAVINHGRG